MENWLNNEYMIAIDLILLTIATSAIIFMIKYKHIFKLYQLTNTMILILSGLLIIISIYALDLFSMTVLPKIIGASDAFKTMENLHMKHAWGLNFIGLSAIAIGIYKLISKFIKTLTNLEVTKKELLSALNTKERFLAKMSHELRTPLTAIIGFSAILNRQSTDMEKGNVPGLAPSSNSFDSKRIPTNKTILNYSHYILESGQQLLSLIEHLLYVANPKEQLENPDIGPIDLKPIIDDTIIMMTTAARQKGIKIKNTLPKIMPPVIGNDMALCQVFLNLLNNAISFSKENSTIEITGSMNKKTFFCHIEDHGIGISNVDMHRIFEPFEQANDSIEGLGLGLPVCNKFMDKLGGSLNIDSKLGVGTKVTVGLIKAMETSISTTHFTAMEKTIH
jgi:signal transduction histidine kinase